MNEQGRLTYLTRHYYSLQGIRIAPMWLYFLVIEATAAASIRGSLFDGIILLALGLWALWNWLAGRYYRHTFGGLQPTWIVLPMSRFYWGLVLGSFIFVSYLIIFRGIFGDWPYFFTLIWVSPLFDEENPPLRRIYYALGSAVVVFSTLFIQLAHGENKIIIAIQCVVLLALGLADHLLLMSLRAPAREGVDG